MPTKAFCFVIREIEYRWGAKRRRQYERNPLKAARVKPYDFGHDLQAQSISYPYVIISIRPRIETLYTRIDPEKHALIFH